MNRRFLLIAGALALAGCVSVAPPPGAAFPELEALYAVTASREMLTIRVASSGCTKKEDFAFFVEEKPGGVTLAFGRKRMDPCQSFAPGHADLMFSYEELGVSARTPIFIVNPFAPDPSPP